MVGKSALAVVVLCLAMVIGAGQLAADPVVYAHDGAGQLFTLDVATGTVQIIGSMGAVMTDIAFDPAGNLYGVTFSALYQIDPATASVTHIGSLGVSFVNALVFAPDGTLYTAGSGLYSVDVTTGSASYIGDLSGYGSAGDLAFDGSGTLYLSTDGNDLVTVDPSTGSAALVGAIGFSDVYGLAYGSDGVMYGLSNRTSDAFTIDLSTGAGTWLSSFAAQGVSGAWGASFYTEARCDVAVFEPPITNNDFALKDGTTVPIKFHLEDCDGNVIEEPPLAAVTVEVTGPNASGVPTTYVFSLDDGTLKYDDAVYPPHYVANFSTKTYSVMDGGNYTAEVKEDSAVIGSIGFGVSTSAGTGRGNRSN